MANEKCKINAGFSLLEIIVTVSIIAVLSVSAVVGFRYMGDTLRTKEAKGIITDTIKKVELEMIRESYQKSTINFLEDYLVVVSEPEENNLELTLGASCSNGHNIEFGSDGNLIKKDGEGETLSAKTVVSGTDECVEFTESSETEWQYQIISNGDQSNIIRFIHFNINRTNPSGITISSGVGATMAIEAPYAKKTLSTDPISLEISGENSSETLTIQ